MSSSCRWVLVFVVWVGGLVLLPRPAAADTKTLRSSAPGAGMMTVSVDQYGTMDEGARFTPADGAPSIGWQYFGLLVLTDGTGFALLGDQQDWGRLSPPNLFNLLPDEELEFDTVEAARRTSQFRVFGDIVVDLVQEIPEAGYNFVQTYTFSNPTAEPISLKMTWFNDQDHGDALDDRVGFVPGPMPRMYFIDDQDLAGPGHPSLDDRANRISVITQPGPGVQFDGYLGGWVPQGGAFGLWFVLPTFAGFQSPFFDGLSTGEDLNTIREILGGGAVFQLVDGALEFFGNDADQDADGLVDSPGDVSGALQFSVDLPANGSTSLGINYVGGSLQNAVFQNAVAPPLQAGDADMDLDFDQLDLVRVQVAAKYLTGQAATWGEGDWNAAPGGSPGNPPTGDSLFNQVDIIAALTAGKYLSGPYAAVAPSGSRGDGQTSIIYNPTTGELAVDAPAGTQLSSINIDSGGAIFTGQAAQNLGGSFDNDSDNNIFKATFGSSFGSLSFGNVAQPGLAKQFLLADLIVVGSLAGGGALGDVDLVYVPEPSALVLAVVGLLTVFAAMGQRRSTVLRESACH